MKAATLVAALALSLAAPRAAQAQVELEDSSNYFTLSLPVGWQAATPVAGTESIITAFVAPGSERELAVTRVDYPNRAAGRDPSTFFAQVEAGLQRSSPGYTRLARKQRRFAHVRVLDLTFRHSPAQRDAEVMAIRFLFFRTFSLSLAVAGKASRYRRQRRSTQAILASFRPHLGK